MCATELHNPFELLSASENPIALAWAGPKQTLASLLSSVQRACDPCAALRFHKLSERAASVGPPRPGRVLARTLRCVIALRFGDGPSPKLTRGRAHFSQRSCAENRVLLALRNGSLKERCRSMPLLSVWRPSGRRAPANAWLWASARGECNARAKTTR